MKWGDSPDQVAERIADDGLLNCGKVAKGRRNKGYLVNNQDCSATAKEISGISKVLLIYLDGRLGRIVIVYGNMTPGSSNVHNLEEALKSRYGDLDVGLDDAVTQARSGNFGEQTQLSFQAMKEIDIVAANAVSVTVINRVKRSDVEIYLSSEPYVRYLLKNEFANTF